MLPFPPRQMRVTSQRPWQVAQWFSENAPTNGVTPGLIPLPTCPLQESLALLPTPRLFSLDCAPSKCDLSLQAQAPCSPAKTSPDLAKFLHFLAALACGAFWTSSPMKGP